MSRRPLRRHALPAFERDELLRKAHALWSATAGTMRHLQTSGSDYRAAIELSDALCAFANRISDGQADFAQMSSTRGGGRLQAWLVEDGDLRTSVETASQFGAYEVLPAAAEGQRRASYAFPPNVR